MIVTNEMVFNINILRFHVPNWIFNKCYCTLIIVLYVHWQKFTLSDIFQKLCQTNNFLTCNRWCHILSFACWKSYWLLTFWFPTNSWTIFTKHETMEILSEILYLFSSNDVQPASHYINSNCFFGMLNNNWVYL